MRFPGRRLGAEFRRRRAQFVGLVRFLPRRVDVRAAEVAVCGGRPVDRTAQLEVADDPPGAEIEVIADELLDRPVVDLVRAERLDRDADRLRVPDGVREFDFAAIEQPGGDEVLGDPAGGV